MVIRGHGDRNELYADLHTNLFGGIPGKSTLGLRHDIGHMLGSATWFNKDQPNPCISLYHHVGRTKSQQFWALFNWSLTLFGGN